MKYINVFFWSLLVISATSFGQTFNTTGDWNTATNWNTGSVPLGTGANVTLAANTTLTTGANNTIGNVTVNSNVIVAVDNGATLTLGSSVLFGVGTKKSMTLGDNEILQIIGLLEIWGDLIINDNLALQITGSGQLIVHGNVTMNSNGAIQLSGTGSLSVGGNFTGGVNATFQTGGSATVSIAGNLSLGNGTITGPIISVRVGGICTCGNGCCSSSTLPITLTSFMATIAGAGIQLEWVTSSEVNFNYFDLERSSNEISFSEIAQMDGHGTTQETHLYSFEDTSPLIGNNYYRLRSVDFDGFSEAFNVVLVEFNGVKDFSISPNPTDGVVINLKLNFSPKERVTLIISDNLGNKIMEQAIDLPETKVAFENPLKSGLYFVQVVSGAFSKTVRFVVVN